MRSCCDATWSDAAQRRDLVNVDHGVDRLVPYPVICPLVGSSAGGLRGLLATKVELMPGKEVQDKWSIHVGDRLDTAPPPPKPSLRERVTNLTGKESRRATNPAQPLVIGQPLPVADPGPVGLPQDPDHLRGLLSSRRARFVAFLLVVVPAVALRVMYLTNLGFNSDEAVYAGQGLSLAGNMQYVPYFPVFRAHPLLFQTLLSVPYSLGADPMAGRYVAAALGLATVGLTYLIGRDVYGRGVGFAAALFMAVMPYHVLVSRQVLLDDPMVFCATLSLYLIARYAATSQPLWLYAASATLGLTFLAKETSVLLLGGVYAFFAISAAVRVRFRDMIVSAVVFVLVVLPFPVSIALSGKQTTGEQFLAWQLFRRPNHSWTFYPSVVPMAIGLGVVAAALIGLWMMRRSLTWRETLMLCWIAMPFLFFQIWPVKGFQYLLPIAPPLAILAARTVTVFPRPGWTLRGRSYGTQTVALTVLIAITASLLIPSVLRVRPASAGTEFLAGSGGVPGGREAGEWVGENVPEGGTLLALGPSMANILQFYGDRKAYGLSVSPNPLHRNPVYEPLPNPDRLLRNNELQYLVWDSYSASRSPFFSERLLRYAERYHGRIVHTEYVVRTTGDGERVERPVIVIYEVRP